MNTHLVEDVTSRQIRHDIPEFSSGDTVRVFVRIFENKKERIQVYEGVVIQRRGHVDKPLIAMIKGDAQCLNVAAASILAKVSRDHYMDELDAKYPQYGFKHHKGYGTKEHLEALEKYGPIEGVHRKTFRPVSDYYSVQGKLF